jgi:hypothetical protein
VSSSFLFVPEDIPAYIYSRNFYGDVSIADLLRLCFHVTPARKDLCGRFARGPSGIEEFVEAAMEMSAAVLQQAARERQAHGRYAEKSGLLAESRPGLVDSSSAGSIQAGLAGLPSGQLHGFYLFTRKRRVWNFCGRRRPALRNSRATTGTAWAG